MRHQIRRMLHKVTRSRLCGCQNGIIPVCCQVLPHQVSLILLYCTFLWTWLSCGGAAVRPVWSTSGRSEGRSTSQFWGKNPRPYHFDLQNGFYHLKYINLLLPTQSCVLYTFGCFINNITEQMSLAILIHLWSYTWWICECNNCRIMLLSSLEGP